MAYVPFKAGITTETGYAVGKHGAEVQVITSAGRLTLPSATTAISLAGTYSSDAVAFSGTFTGDAIDMSGTFNGHMIYLHPTSLAAAKRAFRIGDYGAETTVTAGGGIVRTYAKVATGTDGTAFAFHWGIVESNAPIWVEQIQAESQAPTTGPTTVCATAFFAGIASTKYLGASTGAFDGLYATHHKVYASADSVCSGDVHAIFLDNQMSCAVGGSEYSIKSATGGTVPDAWAGFSTTSSGWSALFKFDSTMVGKAPISTNTPDTQTYPGDGSLIININGTDYFIPYYTAAHC